MKSHGVFGTWKRAWWGNAKRRFVFCSPWPGQVAGRWNRRVTRPNAIRVSVINDWVDPVSATAPTVVHVPGESKLAPKPVSLAPWSWMRGTRNVVVRINPVTTSTLTNQPVIVPAGPVTNWNIEVTLGVRFVIVCTPSENVKAMGEMVVSGMFGGRGPASLIIPDTKSLVV